jgi:hypothetical protein
LIDSMATHVTRITLKLKHTQIILLAVRFPNLMAKDYIIKFNKKLKKGGDLRNLQFVEVAGFAAAASQHE